MIALLIAAGLAAPYAEATQIATTTTLAVLPTGYSADEDDGHLDGDRAGIQQYHAGNSVFL